MLSNGFSFKCVILFPICKGGCEPDPCKNGGKCSETTYDNVNMTVMNEMNKYVKINDKLKSFYCECREGFSGSRCEYGDGNNFYFFVISN